jgi:hypothetical protein
MYVTLTVFPYGAPPLASGSSPTPARHEPDAPGARDAAPLAAARHPVACRNGADGVVLHRGGRLRYVVASEDRQPQSFVWAPMLSRNPYATSDGRARSHPLIRRCYVSRAGPLSFPSLKDRERSFATARIRLQQITPSIRGRPSGAEALAGNTWAGSPWRAAG